MQMNRDSKIFNGRHNHLFTSLISMVAQFTENWKFLKNMAIVLIDLAILVHGPDHH